MTSQLLLSAVACCRRSRDFASQLSGLLEGRSQCQELKGTLLSATTSPFLNRAWRSYSSAAVSLQPELSNEVMPQEMAAELRALESQLYTASRRDGWKRRSFSLNTLDVSVPDDVIEPGLPTLTGHVRIGTGKNSCKWLRRNGRMPANIISLPTGQNLDIHLPRQDGEKLVRQFGVNGCMARIVQINIVHPEDETNVLGKFRVKPQQVKITSNTALLEAIAFLYCPPDRIVKVDVPIKLVNDDAAPGVKKGGWMAMERRVVQYRCLGSSVPPFIEVDVRHLQLEESVRLRQLPIPPGTKIVAKNYDVVVVRCTTSVGKDT